MPASRRTFGAAVVALVVTGTSAGGHAARPMAGTTERQLVVGGVTRTYLLHAGGEPKPGRPLVLVLHGWRGSAAGIARRTKGRSTRSTVAATHGPAAKPFTTSSGVATRRATSTRAS